MIDLNGLVAVVTGGSRGIGAEASVLLATGGADVAVLYSRNRKAALDVCRRIEVTGKSGMPFRCRVEEYADCKRAVSEILKEFGKIDILVNSAGIWEEGSVGTMAPKEWDKTIAVNLTGTFNMCNLVVPAMKARRFGRIVNISSTAGQRGEANHSHYAASKGGIIAFTKSIAVELIRYGIRVNCVAPGWVRTEMVAGALKSPKEMREIIRAIPRGKVATPGEIAGSIVFLASELAEPVVGEVLNANGGSVLCG